MTDELLPALPEPKILSSGYYMDGVSTYTAGQLHAYAREAIRQQWRPISEAPKDGSSVLAYAGEVVTMRYIADRDCNLWVYTDEILSDACPDPDQPTHFMPLPSPPAGDVA